MTSRHCVSVGVVALGVLAVVGCNRDRERMSGVGAENTPTVREQTGTTTVTGASLANNSAIERIVAARCEREAACRNIGPDKKHSSAQLCAEKLRVDMKSDLNAQECPAGIDQKELGECLESIRKEDCGNPIDSISRLAACRTGDMCKKTTAPNH
jgi:hypothetical protein